MNLLKVIDLDQGTQLARNQRELAQEILTLLVSTLRTEVDEILAAFSRGDTAEVRRLAHKLHGAVCYCGVPRLKQSLYDLESALKQQSPTVKEHLERLETEAQLVIEEVKKGVS